MISGERIEQLDIFCRVTGFTSDFLSFIDVELIWFFHGALQFFLSFFWQCMLWCVSCAWWRPSKLKEDSCRTLPTKTRIESCDRRCHPQTAILTLRGQRCHNFHPEAKCDDIRRGGITDLLQRLFVSVTVALMKRQLAAGLTVMQMLTCVRHQGICRLFTTWNISNVPEIYF